MAKPSKLSDLSPYAPPFGGAQLRADMLVAGVTKGWLAAMAGVTPRAVELWWADKRPIPPLVRKLVRGLALGLLPRATLECL